MDTGVLACKRWHIRRSRVTESCLHSHAVLASHRFNFFQQNKETPVKYTEKREVPQELYREKKLCHKSQSGDENKEGGNGL